MRKWKSLCLEYKKYEQMHKENIMLMALQMQIRSNPKGKQVRFLREAAKNYCMKNFPTAYRQMEETDWDDVAKRYSTLWQQEKNSNDKFDRYRVAYPAFFYKSNQEANAPGASIGAKVVSDVQFPIPLWDDSEPDEGNNVIPSIVEKGVNLTETPVTPQPVSKTVEMVPGSDTWINALADKFSNVNVVMSPDGSRTIQFSK
jgi:hypothetical protein